MPSAFIKIRLFILSRIIVFLSIPFLLFSCRNISKSPSGKKAYESRADIAVKDTLFRGNVADSTSFESASKPDYVVIPTVPPAIYFDPEPQCDYGVIYTAPPADLEYSIYPFDNAPENLI